MKFTTHLEGGVSVEFSDPEASKREYIDGDWKEVFWDISDMEELVTDIVNQFNIREDTWTSGLGFVRFLEGFGDFIKTETDTYICKSSVCGDITIVITDPIEVMYVDEEDC